MADNIATAFVELRADTTKLESDAKEGVANLERSLSKANALWSDIMGDASRTGEDITASFTEAGKQSDAELKQIGGPDTWGDIKQDAAKAGESIEGSMREAGGKSKGHLDGIKSAGVGMFTTIAGLAAGAGVGFFLKDAASGAADAASGMRELQSIIDATGSAAGLSATQIAGMAQDLSVKIGVDDDDIIAAQGVLLTFKQIGGESFSRVTADAADMAAVFGGDMTSAATQLGKALNDPVAGVSALSRVGVTFTEEQKAQIKAMSDAGDIAGAQGIVLAELEGQVKGAAEASATGAQKMSVAFGELKESLGGGIAGALENIAPQVVGLLDALQAPLATLGDALGDAIGPIIDALGPALTSILPAVSAVLTTISKLFSALIPIITPIIAAVSTLATLFAGVLGEAIDALTPSLTIIGQVLGDVLAVVLPVIVSLFQALSPIIALVGKILSTTLAAVLPIIVGVFKQLMTALQPLIPILQDSLLRILNAIAPVLPVLVTAFLSLVQALVPLLAALLPLIGPLLQIVTLLVEKLAAPVLIEIANAIAFVAGVLATLLAAVSGFVAGVIQSVADFITGLVETPGKVGEVIGQIGAFFAGLPATVGTALLDLLNTVVTSIGNMALAAIEAVGGFILDFLEFYVTLPLKVGEALISLAPTVVGAIAGMALDGIAAVSGFVTDALAGIAGFVTGIPGELLDLGTTIATGITDGLADGITSIETWVGDALSAVGKFVTGIPGALLDAGGALLSGISNAFKSAWNGVIDALPTFTIPNPLPFSDDWTISLDFLKLANGAVLNRATAFIGGEAGTEAVIPVTRPARALQLMNQTGLTDLALSQRGAASAVHIEHATFQDATDADLVAQRVNAAVSARLVNA